MTLCGFNNVLDCEKAVYRIVIVFRNLYILLTLELVWKDCDVSKVSKIHFLHKYWNHE